MKIVWTIIILIVAAVVAGFLFLYSGLYDISALKSHTAITLWVLDTAKDNSIKHHAHGIAVPPLSDASMLSKGSMEYRMSCEGCHGGPGVEQPEMIKGFNPMPPELMEAAADWSPAEFYWITKNGIKMTGMPAWKPSLSEDDLWAITAFAKTLPGMTPEAYKGK